MWKFGIRFGGLQFPCGWFWMESDKNNSKLQRIKRCIPKPGEEKAKMQHNKNNEWTNKQKKKKRIKKLNYRKIFAKKGCKCIETVTSSSKLYNMVHSKSTKNVDSNLVRKNKMKKKKMPKRKNEYNARHTGFPDNSNINSYNLNAKLD